MEKRSNIVYSQNIDYIRIVVFRMQLSLAICQYVRVELVCDAVHGFEQTNKDIKIILTVFIYSVAFSRSFMSLTVPQCSTGNKLQERFE